MYINYRKKFKFVIYLSALALIFNASFMGAFFSFIPLTNAGEDMCSVDVDVVLVMDRSGSMDDGENPTKCEWWELKWFPAEQTNKWVLNTTENKSEAWCATKNLPAPRNSTFYPATPKKINAAKDAANSFLNNMGASDQSGLVSFSDSATLDKSLSTAHNATKSAVNALVPFGSTNIGEAINFATQELDQHQNGQAVKVMILLTDGKANLPNGDGYHENAQDIQYAIDEASLAAQKNYKIFTVGLGSDGDINATMLQQIADVTGANYHHAPNGNDLSDIYNDIAWEICQYGSISGCKYNDENNNGSIDPGEPTVNGWEVALNNSISTTTQTVLDGCYTFAGLEDGEYIISEIVQPGWTQTYPPEGFYSVTISNHNDVVDQDFANYFPECGNNILDNGETCDDGNLAAGDGCSAICEIEIQEPVCGNNILEDGEECDDGNTDDGDSCSSLCLLEISPEIICGDGIQEGSEECDDGNNEDGDGCSSICEIEEPTYQCSDGQDNDADGLIDELDPGCWDDGINSNTYNPEDDDEIDMTPVGIQPGDIIINELMWMGSNLSSVDEWIELKNATNKSIDLSNCYLTKKVGSSDSEMISATSFVGKIISAQNYFLISNYNKDNSNINIDPEIVDSSVSLYNNNLQIKLFCNDILIDTADDGSGVPLMGDNVDKKSMSRKLIPSDGTLAENWCTASTQVNWDAGATELGTPGAQNVCEGEPTGPICGDQVIEDPEVCEIGDSQVCEVDGYSGNQTCNSNCDGWDGCQSSEFCGDGQINGDEFCDDGELNGQQDFCNETCAGYTVPFECSSTISGKKYNGNQEDEIYLQGWDIELYDDQQSLITTVTTGENGYYIFENLCLGTYNTKEVQQTGWQQIYPLDAQDNPTFYTDIIAEENTHLVDRDFSNMEIQTGYISGYKYEDTDGQADTFDDWVGLENWTIKLLDEQLNLITTITTDSWGKFEFSNLFDGNYNLAEELKDDWIQFKYPTTTISILNGSSSTWDKNDFVNYYEGPATYCGDNTKQSPNLAGTGGPADDGYEECDGVDGVTPDHYCTDLCVLAENGAPVAPAITGGGGGGGGTADICGDGILNEATEECDGIYGTPAGYICTELCLLELIEEEEEEEGEVAGEEVVEEIPEVPAPIVIAPPVETGAVAGEEEVVEEQPEIVLPIEICEGDECCPFCSWWQWIIIAGILVILSAGYQIVFEKNSSVKPKMENKAEDKIDEQQNKLEI